ncbi:uncharacterized protein LOC135827809 isoform X2 [Sycon ciliatum]|uniref:uncharacterized protein LOC135827809 isoform X2 n=1 Tax=Sycon ciliatum TaxID=27933 RepID=UPI0031F641FD
MLDLGMLAIRCARDVGKPRHVLILIKTGTDRKYKWRRNNLRNSWFYRCRSGEYYPPNVKIPKHLNNIKLSCYFIIGVKHISKINNESLEDENRKYGDIIYARDINDLYSTFLMKTVWMLNWATLASTRRFVKRKQPDVPVTHVMLADDDTFVTLSLFINWASRLPLARVFTGHAHRFSRPLYCHENAHPNCIDSKAYPSLRRYPRYPSGFAYLLSLDVCVGTVQSAIRHSAMDCPVPGNNEDALMGLLTAEAGFTLIHEPSFHHFAQQVFPCPGDGVPLMVIGNAPQGILNIVARNERLGERNLCRDVVR